MGLGLGGSPRLIPSWGRCWGGHPFFIRVCGAISGPGFDDGLGLDLRLFGCWDAGEGWSQVGVDAGVATLFFIRVCGAISGPGFDDGLGLGLDL